MVLDKKDNESLFEAWERYKDMIRLCPHHGLEEWLIIHMFYNGLLYNTRMTIDAAGGGALMDKPYAEANQLIESMAQNHYHYFSSHLHHLISIQHIFIAKICRFFKEVPVEYHRCLGC